MGTGVKNDNTLGTLSIESGTYTPAVYSYRNDTSEMYAEVKSFTFYQISRVWFIIIKDIYCEKGRKGYNNNTSPIPCNSLVY